MILEGRVAVNGKKVSILGSKVDPDKDQVALDGKLLRAEHKGILILNKPAGVVTTLSDPEGRKTVQDFLTKKYISYFPVGRLDTDSTGLVIMTNDGELAERLLHPRYELPRIYVVTVEGRISDGALNRIERGVRLEDGEIKGQVRFLDALGDFSRIEITIREGRNRIIRRLMEKLGHPVKKLHRISHGPFRIGSLRAGEIKVLTQKEYERLRDRVMKDEN